MSIRIVADSLTTEQVRSGLRAMSRIARHDTLPRSIETRECEGMAWVGLNGADHWRLKTPQLTPGQAVFVAHALATPGDFGAGLEVVLAIAGFVPMSMVENDG